MFTLYQIYIAFHANTKSYLVNLYMIVVWIPIQYVGEIGQHLSDCPLTGFWGAFLHFFQYTCMTLHLKGWYITASLYLITEIAQKSPFLHVNESPKSSMVFIPPQKVSIGFYNHLLYINAKLKHPVIFFPKGSHSHLISITTCFWPNKGCINRVTLCFSYNFGRSKC